MRKITAGLFISLDGVVEDPQDWHFPYFNDEMGAAVDGTARRGRHDALRPQDLRQLRRGVARARGGRRGGRRVSPRSSATPARSSCRSQQLEFTWRNSEQLKGDLVEAVTALKNEPGGDIGMSGSVSVVRQLLAAGLLDELHLLVHPIAVRKGMRLFDEGETPIPLTAALVPDLQDRRAVPRLRPGRLDRRRGTYEDAKVHLSRPQPQD